MKSEYRYWMLLHVVAFVVYLALLIFFSALGIENKYPFNILLFAQAITSVVLWLLINNKLFKAAYYLAWIIAVLSTYNFYSYMSKDITFLPSFVNEIFKYIVYFAVIFYALIIYILLVQYPKKVIKTARKLKLI